MRFRVRRANIKQTLREQFEMFGEQVIAVALGVGSDGMVSTAAQKLVRDNPVDAILWLREQRDYADRHATRVELLGWAILVLLAVEVAFDVGKVFSRI